MDPRFTTGLSPVYHRFISGTRSALCSWLPTSGTTLFCLCKPFSCKACPGIRVRGEGDKEKGRTEGEGEKEATELEEEETESEKDVGMKQEKEKEKESRRDGEGKSEGERAVSYTHLTLPTN